jgi:predicted enzyme related to lactoylglutathione lyase
MVIIEPRVDAVFIHVSDMPRAIHWYSRLLGLPVGKTAHEGMIYDLPVEGGTGILLDAYPKPVAPRGTGPRVMFDTHDLDAALAHARAITGTVTEPEDIGSAIVFYIEDPDGNRICIIWRKP